MCREKFEFTYSLYSIVIGHIFFIYKFKNKENTTKR